jgi:phage-related protein
MFKIILYRTQSGREIIVDFISSFSDDDINKIRTDIRLLKDFGLALMSASKVKKILVSENIYELRTKASLQIRLLFVFIKPNVFLILHGFVKKTNKTPIKEIKTAVNRKKEFDI